MTATSGAKADDTVDADDTVGKEEDKTKLSRRFWDVMLAIDAITDAEEED